VVLIRINNNEQDTEYNKYAGLIMMIEMVVERGG